MPKPDPVLVHARRELVVILAVFAVFICWSVGVSYWLGYGAPSAPVEKVLGMPAWVFWGVLVPWLAADVVITWFCFFFMQDDLLGEEEEDAIERHVRGEGEGPIADAAERDGGRR